MSDSPTPVDQRIVDAALALSAEMGWTRVTLAAIAAKANAPLDTLYGRFASKTDVLDLVYQSFDRAAVQELDLDADAAIRERVFDAVMALFDAMEPQRAGLLAMDAAVGRDPALTLRQWRWTQRSARWLLELARVDTAGLKGLARVQGLAVILRRTRRAWAQDIHGDLSRTMATLDRALRDVAEFSETWRQRLALLKRQGRKARSSRSAANPAPAPEPINLNEDAAERP